MAAALTEKEFSQHVNTKFQLKLDDQKIELELVEVKGYLPQANEQTGMERFSVFFDGPGDVRLPQRLYSLQHEQMGEIEIFLVPVSGNGKGFRYEAVFNYFRK
jgi:uncharacterized protein DUF6916